MKSSRAKGTIAAVARICLGGVLFLSGIQKLGTTFAFQQILANYKLLPTALELPLAVLIPWLELVSGLCLLSGVFIPAAAVISMLLCTGFGLFVGTALARGLDVDCGCFAYASRVSWVHLGFDVLLLTASCFVLLFGAERWSLETLLASSPAKQTRGKKSVALVLGFASTMFLASHLDYFRATRGGENPSLAFEPSILQFGTMSPGQRAERSVVYQNVGKEPLEIIWVQSSCRCTVPQPGQRKLSPGEKGTLTVQFEASAGDARQTLRVYQRGKSNPAILKVTAEIVHSGSEQQP